MDIPTRVRFAKVGAVLAAFALVWTVLGVMAPRSEAADPSLTGVNLADYSLVGRYSLPEPTNTTPPDGTSLLAQEASAVTYDWDTDTLFVVGDGGTSVVQVSKTGKLIDSETLAPGSSPQGTTFYDTEAVTYVGNGKFVLGEERYRQVNLFTYQAGHTLTKADVQTVKLGTTIGNIGIEGVSYDPQTTTDPANPGFIVVKEKQPEGIFQTNVNFAAGTASNGSPTTDESTNLFDPSLVGTSDFSDVFALSNLPNLTGPDAQNLLVDSQESGKIVEVTRSGQVESSLTITDSGAPLSVPDETHEGVTMDRAGNLYTVSEDGGGDQHHPQLWVYSPTPNPPPRVAVTEVAPWGSGTNYGADWFELTNTGATDVNLSGWKMDDSSDSYGSAVPMTGLTTLPAGKSAVFFEDDSGTNHAAITSAFAQDWFGTSTLPSTFLTGFYGGSGVGLSTSGDAVNLFDANGNPVTGVSFGASPSSDTTFDNSARVGSSTTTVPIADLAKAGTNGAFTSADGQEIGSPAQAAPSGTTTPPPSGGGTTAVAVTEVAPWGSGNTPYAADWFELTNTGASAVDLTGWKMDDNSSSFASAVALHGVTSLPAGASAVFIEDTSDTDADLTTKFSQAWFGTATPPASLRLGFYGGSGVGLSTGGDAVTIFDANGNQVTGVQFGASPSNAPFASFDNSADIGSTTLPLPTISTLSVNGVNGAFTSPDGQEIGSPGVAGSGPAPALPEAGAPWELALLGGLALVGATALVRRRRLRRA